MAETIQVGAATVTLFNVAYTQFKPEQFMNVPDSEHAELFGQAVLNSINCVHVALPRMSLLVDASAVIVAPGAPESPPNLQQPPGLLAQMAAAGIQPSQITHVVITHTHQDHINGLTIERDGRVEPNFPNAQHYLGRADWEDGDFQKALRDPASVESHTLGELDRQGLLQLVEGHRDLGEGVSIVATPGETRGHQMVRVHSEGQTLYCTGDLYHFQFEFEHPEWMAHWKDREATLASRRALVEAAVAEDALLVVTHIPGLGRLQRSAAGVAWREANAP